MQNVRDREQPASIRGVLYVPHGTTEIAVDESALFSTGGIVFMAENDTIWGEGGVLERLHGGPIPPLESFING